ncbi:hypothetical protein TRIUR3_24491 [Triticum urartu]|uniref:Uncharacterized protein n=1 Tax=Triticum urartu TaxID=4572 RepID=M7ZPE0_TRIUA|nr:hypothetical protein TRIUR3_24491 [Triticum urartu]
MAQHGFLSSLRSHLRSPPPPSHTQPRRGYHVELGAREKALLEEDVALKSGRRRPPRPARVVCRRAKNAAFEDYKFPDPIPEFAEQETSKFREHMTWRLEQKKEQYFGEHVEDIVDVCTEARYPAPTGEIKERGLPGAPQAARAAIAWAEKNIDKDWKEWTGDF